METSNNLTGERRRRNRLSSETQAWIVSASQDLLPHQVDEQDAWEVRVTNLSRLGVGFMTTQQMCAGDQHRLRIGRGPMTRSRLIRVVVCRQGTEGDYAIGAEFVDHPAHTLSRAG